MKEDERDAIDEDEIQNQGRGRVTVQRRKRVANRGGDKRENDDESNSPRPSDPAFSKQDAEM